MNMIHKLMPLLSIILIILTEEVGTLRSSDTAIVYICKAVGNPIFTSGRVGIPLTVLQMVQCAAIYPEKDWPSNEGSDMQGNVNLLNAMTKRSFCPRAFTWNPSLRTCLPTLAALRSRMGRRSRY